MRIVPGLLWAPLPRSADFVEERTTSSTREAATAYSLALETAYAVMRYQDTAQRVQTDFSLIQFLASLSASRVTPPAPRVQAALLSLASAAKLIGFL